MREEQFLRPLFDWRSAVASPFGPKNPTTRHVLLTLSLHMSAKGDSCFPSIERLTEESGLSRRAVLTHLAAAAEQGWICKRDRPEKNGQGWRRIEYFSLIPKGIEEAVKSWAEGGARGALPSKKVVHVVPKGGARGAPKVVHHVHLSSSVEDVKEDGGGGVPPPAGQPTPVARAFQAYSEGIKRKYNADYPPSAKANGQLANVVARVGGDNVLAVVGWYLGSRNKFYGQVKHSLDYLVRDCEKLFLELQAATGGGPPPSIAHVALLADDGSVKKRLGDVGAGDAEGIARAILHEYSGLIRNLQPKYISVVQGAERRRYSLEELTPEEQRQ